LKSIVGITSAARRAAAANLNTLNRKARRATWSDGGNVAETGREDNVAALTGDTSTPAAAAAAAAGSRPAASLARTMHNARSVVRCQQQLMPSSSQPCAIELFSLYSGGGGGGGGGSDGGARQLTDRSSLQCSAMSSQTASSHCSACRHTAMHILDRTSCATPVRVGTR